MCEETHKLTLGSHWGTNKLIDLMRADGENGSTHSDWNMLPLRTFWLKAPTVPTSQVQSTGPAAIHS